MKSSTIQAILFKKNYYNSYSARKYMKKHKFKPIKRVHKTKNFLRYRLKNPSIFNSFITIKINNNKIHLIIGNK